MWSQYNVVSVHQKNEKRVTVNLVNESIISFLNRILS